MSETVVKKVDFETLHTYDQFKEVLAAGITPEMKPVLRKRVSNLMGRGKLSDKEGRDLILASEGMGGDAQKQIDQSKPLSERAHLDERGKVVIPFASDAGFGMRGFGLTPKQWDAILNNVDEIRKGVARVVEENPGWEAVYELNSDLYKQRRVNAAKAKAEANA